MFLGFFFEFSFIPTQIKSFANAEQKLEKV